MKKVKVALKRAINRFNGFVDMLRRSGLIGDRLYLKLRVPLANSAFEMGALFMELDRSEVAYNIFLDELKRRPNSFGLWKQAGCSAFQGGRFDLAIAAWENGRRLQSSLRNQFQIAPHVPRILGNSWFLAVGHVANLDSYLKMRILELGDSKNEVAPVAFMHPNQRLPNSYLFSLFKEYFQTVETEDELPLENVKKDAILDEWWTANFGDGRTVVNHWGWSEVEREWDLQGKAPLLKVPPSDREECYQTLEKMGMSRGAWFVTLHVRESGFHKAWNEAHPSFRDAKVEDYIPAIKLITSLGGWVVRIGDPSMTRLPPMKNVIDYAHSNLKSPKMDVILCSENLFYVGTNSGMYFVAAAFGARCVLTNWAPLTFMPYYKNDKTILKLYRSKSRNRLLKLEEMLTPEIGYSDFTKRLPNDVEVIDNSPSEILQVVEEMLSDLNLLPQSNWPQVADIEQRFNAVCSERNFLSGTSKGRAFLARYGPDLLDS